MMPARWVASLPSYGNPHAVIRRDDLLRLDNNEHTGPLTASVRGALRAALDEELGGQARIALYPEEALATRVVASYVDGGFGGLGSWPGCSEDNVLLANGCDQAIEIVIRAYCDVDTTVLTTSPTFPMYGRYAASTGASFEQCPYGGEGMDFVYPAERLLDRLGELGRMGRRVLLVLANPDPPTGTAIPAGFLTEVRRRCPHAAVLIDEAYFEFCPAKSLLSEFALDDDDVFFVRSMSKAFGLAGLRIGYVIGSANRISGERSGEGGTPGGSDSYLRKTRGPYDVNELALVAAVAALGDLSVAEAYVEDLMTIGRPMVIDWLTRAGADLNAGEASFGLVRVNDALPGLTADGLLREGVLVRPQGVLPAAGRPGEWFRITYPTSANLAWLARALSACGLAPDAVP